MTSQIDETLDALDNRTTRMKIMAIETQELIHKLKGYQRTFAQIQELELEITRVTERTTRSATAMSDRNTPDPEFGDEIRQGERGSRGQKGGKHGKGGIKGKGKGKANNVSFPRARPY